MVKERGGGYIRLKRKLCMLLCNAWKKDDAISVLCKKWKKSWIMLMLEWASRHPIQKTTSKQIYKNALQGLVEGPHRHQGRTQCAAQPYYPGTPELEKPRTPSPAQVSHVLSIPWTMVTVSSIVASGYVAVGIVIRGSSFAIFLYYRQIPSNLLFIISLVLEFAITYGNMETQI